MHLRHKLIPENGYLIHGKQRNFPFHYSDISSLYCELEQAALRCESNEVLHVSAGILRRHLNNLISKKDNKVESFCWAVADIGLCAECLYTVIGARISGNDCLLLECFDAIDDEHKCFYGLTHNSCNEREEEFRKEFAVSLFIIQQTALAPIKELHKDFASNYVISLQDKVHETGVSDFEREITSPTRNKFNDICRLACHMSRCAMIMQFHAIGCALACKRLSIESQWN